MTHSRGQIWWSCLKFTKFVLNVSLLCRTTVALNSPGRKFPALDWNERSLYIGSIALCIFTCLSPLHSSQSRLRSWSVRQTRRMFRYLPASQQPQDPYVPLPLRLQPGQWRQILQEWVHASVLYLQIFIYSFFFFTHVIVISFGRL